MCHIEQKESERHDDENGPKFPSELILICIDGE